MKNEEAYYVIYSRKSKFTGKGESVENQIEMCRNFIAMHYGEKAAEQALVYEDEGFSGGNLERPQFKQMMKDSHKKTFQAIVVYRLDRISRNIGDFAGLIQDLGDRGIDFISIKEQFDTGSPMGRAMMYIASVFSQLERETIAERIRDNMHELAKTGRWLGGNTPTGYTSESVTKVTVDGKTKSAYKLTQVPEEIQLVELIFDKFLETGSLTKTDQYLLEGGYRTKQDHEFTRFAIKGILTNPVYMKADQEAWQYLTEGGVEDLCATQEAFDGTHGIMAYNRTLQRPGKASQINPMSEWIVALGAHEGVIEGKRWVQVQTMLNLNKDKAYRRARVNEALLSGILFCADCGSRMRPKLGKQENDQGERQFSYVCTTKERSQGHLCKAKNIDGNKLDEMIIQKVSEMARQTDLFGTEMTGSRQELGTTKADYQREIRQMEDRQRQTQADIQKLMESLPRYLGTDMEVYISRQMGVLHEQAEETEKRLRELNILAGESALKEYQFDVLQDMIHRIGSQLDAMSPEQRRMAVRLILRKVVWDGENVHLYFLHDTESENTEIVYKKSVFSEKDSFCASERISRGDSE